jgi:hypothetical protein
VLKLHFWTLLLNVGSCQNDFRPMLLCLNHTILHSLQFSWPMINSVEEKIAVIESIVQQDIGLWGSIISQIFSTMIKFTNIHLFVHPMKCRKTRNCHAVSSRGTLSGSAQSLSFPTCSYYNRFLYFSGRNWRKWWTVRCCLHVRAQKPQHKSLFDCQWNRNSFSFISSGQKLFFG